MKKVNAVGLVLAKVVEVWQWIGAAVMLALLVVCIFGGSWLAQALQESGRLSMNTAVDIGGFQLVVTSAEGLLDPTALGLLAVTGMISCSLMAMVFRNVYLILKTTQGKTWFSEGQTPFQKNNTRMVREIGIFLITGPVAELAMSIISRIVLGAGVVEASVDLTSIVIGIMILCLSQSFAYGTQLQRDVDGLV